MRRAKLFTLMLVFLITACQLSDGNTLPAESSLERAPESTVTSAFYRFDSELPAQPGTLLRQEPLLKHQKLERAGANFRLLYSSTEGLAGKQPVAVSGALFLPKGEAPEGGWPLLAWAHGTVGIADHCAPSWNGRHLRDTTYLEFWLANGYAIVASDYQGLGTPGVHPYLATQPEAYSTLDIIRAVQNSDFPVTKAVVLMGQSQGAGAALATAGHSSTYAAELDVRGVVATGLPYFSAEGLTALQKARPNDKVDPMLAYNFLALSMLKLIDPTFELDDYVSDEVLPLARSVHSMCYKELRARTGKERVTYNKAFKVSPADQLSTAFKRMEYPTLALPVPAFLGIGGKDLNTPPRMQMAFAKDACQAGSRISAHFYPGGTHGSVVNGSTNESWPFIQAAFDGKALPGNCTNLPF